MALRPKYTHLWAESALPEDIGDADVYVPQNPAYPEQVANQYSAGWYVSPLDDLVKQPHQWINSWAYTVDLAILELVRSGNQYDTTVSYRKGGIVNVEGVWWTAKASGKLNPPHVSQWKKTQFADVDELQAAIAERNAFLDAHEARTDNPHKVTAAQLSADTQAQTDAKVAAVQSDLNAWKARKDNPHKATPAQLGVLPVTGGVFTGRVTFPQIKQAGGSVVGLYGGVMGFTLNAYNFGIQPSTEVPVSNNTELLTTSSYERMRRRAGRRYLKAAPEAHFLLANDIHTVPSGLGGGTLTGPASFNGVSLKLEAGQSLTTAIPITSGTVIARVDGVTTAKVGTLPLNILSLFTGERISDLKLWSTLLTRQQCIHQGVTVWLP